MYDDNNRSEEPEIRRDHHEATPEITMSELEFAIRIAKRRKAVRADGILIDVVKEAGGNTKSMLLRMLNEIYRSGDLLKDFQVSTFLPIPKMKLARKCSDYRTISIMSHILKLLLTIVNKRLENRTDKYLNGTQFSFRANGGTRDAIALFKVIMQRALAMNRKLFLSLIHI